jgi:hypothetical protein
MLNISKKLGKSTFFLGLRKRERKKSLPPNKGKGGKNVERESTNKVVKDRE